MAIEESTGSDGVTREEDSNGNTVTSSSPSALAAEATIENISSTAKTILNDVLDTSPTITVPHGTRIKIFVNQDLIFPSATISKKSNSGVIFVE
jgi:type IV secretion system protein VirB10